MPAQRPRVLPPPHPTRIFFDPFNSSSTGHQRAENRLSGSTSWRDLRTHKLAHQFGDTTGRGGDRHLSDLVGAGSENLGRDGRKQNGDWEVGGPGLRENGWQDIRALMNGNRKRSSEKVERKESKAKRRQSVLEESSQGARDDTARKSASEDGLSSKEHHDKDTSGSSSMTESKPPQIFRNLTIYLNGSTFPLISDHRLKQVFTQHGGSTCVGLGRRTVTHVILGNSCGGGLASGKIQKEVRLVGGKGIKYVTAQWVLDSVEKGIRQPEAMYVPRGVEGRIGGSGQGSVRGMFMPKTK